MNNEEKTVVINADNMSKLNKIYGNISTNDVNAVINKHLSVAFKAIEQVAHAQRNEMVMAKSAMEYPERKATDFDGEW
jgi:hypothetical protein